MKLSKYIFIAVILLPFSSALAEAATGNWKQGRIYYRMVCTECHAQQPRGKISPNEKTKAEWAGYFEKNVHNLNDPSSTQTVSYFVSRDYRDSIKATNRAAKKLLNVPEDQLLEDVEAFLQHTASDSDQPSRCE